MFIRNRLTSIIICVLLFYTSVSCKKEEPETIVLPPTSVLNVRSNWGVVTSNFLRLRERPSKQANVLMGIPKGIIVEILSNTEIAETIEKETAFWYRVNFDGLFGWVFGAYIEVFGSKKEAEDYSQEIQ
ncbi:MAG: SH3 domain-containing protein [Spirochaetales bacterium]|nr:SH3 domain-containing protein [Spirochaetales bacterium]